MVPTKRARAGGSRTFRILRLLAYLLVALGLSIIVNNWPVAVASFLLLAIPEILVYYRRRVTEADRTIEELRVTITGPLKRLYKSAFEPSMRVGNEEIAEAIQLCDEGQFRSAVEVINRHNSSGEVEDYAALYVRGYAHHGANNRILALKDFTRALECLDYEVGVVQSAIASVYIDEQKWSDARAAAECGIGKMMPPPESKFPPLKRSGRWIPWTYLAIGYALDIEGERSQKNKDAARSKLVNLGHCVSIDDDAISFLSNHPYLQEYMRDDRVKAALSSRAIE